MDKQEKNRKPVNQGKSYKWLRPGADLYHAPHRPGNASHNLWSLWHCQKVLGVGLTFSSVVRSALAL